MKGLPEKGQRTSPNVHICTVENHGSSHTCSTMELKGILAFVISSNLHGLSVMKAL